MFASEMAENKFTKYSFHIVMQQFWLWEALLKSSLL